MAAIFFNFEHKFFVNDFCNGLISILKEFGPVAKQFKMGANLLSKFFINEMFSTGQEWRCCSTSRTSAAGRSSTSAGGTPGSATSRSSPSSEPSRCPTWLSSTLRYGLVNTYLLGTIHVTFSHTQWCETRKKNIGQVQSGSRTECSVLSRVKTHYQ